MRSSTHRLRIALLLFSIASCERIAGLDGKLFGPPESATGGTAGRAAAGGNSGRGGATQRGGASSLGGGAGNGALGGGPAGAAGSDPGDAGEGSGGDDGEGGDGGAKGCVDIAAELCMQPTWPDGVVPYEIDSDSELVSAALRGALASWEGRRVRSTSLHFVEETVPNVKKLVLTLGDGCRPTAITDATLEVAMGACRGRREMSHAVGVALGLPSMHRRADRDRYLTMADASEFSCEKGEFFEKCSNRGEVRAALGPFDFTSDMFAPGRTFESCVEPGASGLYMPRGEFEEWVDLCSWAAGAGWLGYSDPSIGALAELYAISEGWKPFELVGADRGPERLFDSCLEGTSFRGAPSLVATGDGGLAAFALGGEPIDLWLNESDGDSWAAWVKLFSLPALGDHAHGFATALREPGVPIADAAIVDIVVMDAHEIYHLVHHRRYLTAGTWTSLGSPQHDVLSGLAVASGGAGGTFVYTHAGALDPAESRIYVREFDGMTWNEWEPLPPFAAPPVVTSVTSLGVVTLDGEQHLVAATNAGLRYAIRDSSRTWSDWHALTTPDAEHAGRAPDTIALVSNAHYRLAVLGSAGGGELWFYGCARGPCVDAASWSSPYAIGVTGGVSAAASTFDRIDVSTLMRENRPATLDAPCMDGMWHKRWQAPQ